MKGPSPSCPTRRREAGGGIPNPESCPEIQHSPYLLSAQLGPPHFVWDRGDRFGEPFSSVTHPQPFRRELGAALQTVSPFQHEQVGSLDREKEAGGGVGNGAWQASLAALRRRQFSAGSQSPLFLPLWQPGSPGRSGPRTTRVPIQEKRGLRNSVS